MANDGGHGDGLPGLFHSLTMESCGLPLGIRFVPTDQHLICILYENLISKNDDPSSVAAKYGGFLHEAGDLLGKTEPWLIWDQFGGRHAQELYFLSEIKSCGGAKCQAKGKGKGKGGSSRIKRKIEAGGTWSESTSKPVNDLNGNLVGRKRYLRYEKEECKHDGEWLMEEYSLSSEYDDIHEQESPKIVLCRLKKSRVCGQKRKNYNNSSTQDQFATPPNKKARKELGSAQNPDDFDGEEEPQSSSCLTGAIASPQVVCDDQKNSKASTIINDTDHHDDDQVLSNTGFGGGTMVNDHGDNPCIMAASIGYQDQEECSSLNRIDDQSRDTELEPVPMFEEQSEIATQNQASLPSNSEAFGDAAADHVNSPSSNINLVVYDENNHSEISFNDTDHEELINNPCIIPTNICDAPEGAAADQAYYSWVPDQPEMVPQDQVYMPTSTSLHGAGHGSPFNIDGLGIEQYPSMFKELPQIDDTQVDFQYLAALAALSASDEVLQEAWPSSNYDFDNMYSQPVNYIYEFSDNLWTE